MIHSALYYWVVCDGCGARHPDEGDGISAWSDAGDALDSALCEDWAVEDDRHLCPACVLQHGGGREGDEPNA